MTEKVRNRIQNNGKSHLSLAVGAEPVFPQVVVQRVVQRVEVHERDVLARRRAHGVPRGAPRSAAAPAPRAPAPAARGRGAPAARRARLQRVQRAPLRLLPSRLAQDQALDASAGN